MIKYLTKFKTIERVEVERETDSSVWVNGRRNAKRGEYWNYWNTWDDAKAFLLKEAEDNLISARLRLSKAQGEHGNIVGMKNPYQD